MRVQIPVYTDRWMRGDRFGDVIKTKRWRPKLLDAAREQDIAYVKLDISGKTIRVWLDDCTVV